MESHKLLEYLPQLLGLMPITTDGGGNDTELWLKNGSKVTIPKKTKTVLKDLARVFAKDVNLVKRYSEQVLGYKRELPLLLNEDLVLIPVKVREADFKDQGTLGYCVFGGIDGVQPLKNGVFKSALVFVNGQVLFTLNTVPKIRQKLSEARELINYENRRLQWLKNRQAEICAEGTAIKYNV